MKRLRGKAGCPWDRKQTLRSLKRCVLEEAYEVMDAIDSKNKERIQEEIGDMLCVIFLLVAIGEEKGLFDKRALIRRAVRKMVERHPHVFGRERARTAQDALRFFQSTKERERQKKKETLFADFGHSFPALMAAEKIQRKASQVGFDWPNSKGVLKKMAEELRELREAYKRDKKRKIREEMGDFLFSVVNLARKLGVEAETALLESNAKFIRRFKRLEKLAKEKGFSFSHDPPSLKKLNSWWKEVKQRA